MDRKLGSSELKPSFGLDEFRNDALWAEAVAEVSTRRSRLTGSVPPSHRRIFPISEFFILWIFSLPLVLQNFLSEISGPPKDIRTGAPLGFGSVREAWPSAGSKRGS